MSPKKVLLIILDGWGIGKRSLANPIFQAKTPNLDYFFKSFPHSQLQASGLAVGLPKGVMGSSEVGHLNLGAGRIVKQDLVRINIAIKEGRLVDNPVLQDAFKKAKQGDRRLHLLGLVSSAGVHAMDTHLYELCRLAKKAGLSRVFIQAITDGRDTDPHSAVQFIKKLENKLKKTVGVIATIVGRYYTMDRDQRWDRVAVSYRAMVNGRGQRVDDMIEGLKAAYAAGITDEFIKPLIRIDKQQKPIGLVRPGDVVICFNFRTERLREITTALTQKNFQKFGMKTLPLFFYSMTEYDHSFRKVKVIFPKENLKHTLGEVIAQQGFKQLRIAETNKYAHVTFFFSGGRETKFKNEKRILIPSVRVATFDLEPAMSALQITRSVVKELLNGQTQFICLNFANGDLVGHTGIFSAIVKAVETVDQCLGKVVAAARAAEYDVLIVADHGNTEVSRRQDKVSNTAHSTNPVPCLLISADYQHIKNGNLADIAPTILKIMKLKSPPEMTGRVLV